MVANPYVPNPAEITNIFQEYHDIRTFTVRFLEDEIREEFYFDPGQFIQLSISGVGEAPISISSSPTLEDRFRLSIERKGRVTSSMFGMEEGSRIMVRGPYGNGFPMKEVEDKDILSVAGGIGLAPLSSAIEYIYEFKEEYGDIQILYGDKTPACLLYRRNFTRWKDSFDLNVVCEETGPDWTGEEGLVTDLLEEVDLDPENSVAFTCGPPVMYRFVIPKLEKIGFADGDIYLSLERRMECGFGKCRRCNVGDKFVCKDGPVFAYEGIREYMGKET